MGRLHKRYPQQPRTPYNPPFEPSLTAAPNPLTRPSTPKSRSAGETGIRGLINIAVGPKITMGNGSHAVKVKSWLGDFPNCRFNGPFPPFAQVFDRDQLPLKPTEGKNETNKWVFDPSGSHTPSDSIGFAPKKDVVNRPGPRAKAELVPRTRRTSPRSSGRRPPMELSPQHLKDSVVFSVAVTTPQKVNQIYIYIYIYTYIYIHIYSIYIYIFVG